MSDDGRHPHDEELGELLGLVDGELDLPPGHEERLLEQVLATASIPHSRDDGEAVPVGDPTSRARRGWLRPALVVAAVLTVGGALVGPALLDRPPVLPPVLSSDDVTVDPAGLSVAALCERTDAAAFELDLEVEHAAVDTGDREAAADLVLLLAELADRTGPGDAAEVVEALRTAAVLADLLDTDLARGRLDAAARTRRQLHLTLVDVLPVRSLPVCRPVD